MKTRTVTFSYGFIKNASLKIPAEAYSIVDVAHLIWESYFEYMFSRPSLMSDEVLVSSIGQANFFAGALGGWETRLTPDVFASLKRTVESPVALALAVVRYRRPGLSTKETYLRASKNEAVPEPSRRFMALVAEQTTD